MTELFTRDGHLSDLTLERIVQGEIDQASVADYLENCALCRERLNTFERTQRLSFTGLRRLRPVLLVVCHWLRHPRCSRPSYCSSSTCLTRPPTTGNP